MIASQGATALTLCVVLGWPTCHPVDHLRDVDPRARLELFDQGHGPLSGGVIAAREHGDLVDLDVGDGLDERIHHALKLLHQEDVARGLTALLPGVDHGVEHGDCRLTVFDDACGLGLGIGPTLLHLGLCGRHHIREESALDLLDSRSLYLEVLAGLFDECLHFTDLLRDHRLARRLGVGDLPLNVRLEDAHLCIEIADLRDLIVVGLLVDGLGPGVRLVDSRRLDDLGRLLTSDGIQVAHVVRDVLDLEGVEDQSQSAEVVLGLLQELLREADLVLVDLLGCELRAAWSASGCPWRPYDGAAIPTEESLDGVAEEGLVACDLDVGDALTVSGMPPLGRRW